jgi:exopolysaccharide biosynthesis operon protein EpsL
MLEGHRPHSKAFTPAKLPPGWLPLLLLGALVFSGVAVAADNPSDPHNPDTDPLIFTVGAALKRDDNLFRTPDNEQTETVRSLFAGLKVDVPVSLQRFTLDSLVTDNRYANFSQLNYVGINAKGAWNWVVGDRARGNVGYQYQRFLADFGDLQTRTQDLVSQRIPFFDVAYLLTPEWEIVADAARSETSHSESTRNTLDYKLNTGAVGINYITSSKNSIGVRAKRTNADYPNRETFDSLGNPLANSVDNSFRENDFAAVAVWKLTGESRVSARAGYTQREHVEQSSRDFSGGTGEVDYHWVPTGKTTVDFSVYRNVLSSDDLSASYILFRGLSIEPAWAALSTITVKLRAVRELRDYLGDPGIVLGGQRREDTFQSARLSAVYAPTRTLELSLAFEAGKRDSNVNDFDFKYQLGALGGRLAF